MNHEIHEINKLLLKEYFVVILIGNGLPSRGLVTRI